MANKIRTVFFLGVLLTANIFCKHSTGQTAAPIEPVKPGAVLVQVSKQFIFTEGPAVDKNGNIFFTDQPNDKIWEYDVDGKLTLFMDKTNRSNGMYFNSDGLLIACADEKNQLVSIDANKKITPVINDYNGHVLNGPNDVWIERTSGGLYFTDPYYQRDYWTRQKPDLDKQSVYFLAKGKTTAVIVDSTLQQPNGIVGTPDGKYLYVADIRANKTYRYDINKDGSLSNRMLFAPLGSDGMTIDEKGNFYLTGKGVTIFNSSGVQIENIPVPSNWVGNICFGGRDRMTLFITASESIYTLQMQVRGVE